MRRWLRVGAALAALAVVCVAALEALLWVAAPIPLNSPRFQTSARYCTELIPSNEGVLRTVDFRHAFHVDERGERRGAGSHSPSPAQSDRTVAVVGDSMVFGEGVDDGDTFVALLPQALGKRGGGSWDAWNLGIGGHGTGQHVARLEDLVASGRKPGVALVTFFANDPRDDRECRPFRFTANGNDLERVIPATMAHPPPRRLAWLVARPWYRWITGHSQIVGRVRLRAARTEGEPEHEAKRAGVVNALDAPITADELALTSALYRRLARDAESWSIPVGIVLVPHKGCFVDAARRACDEKLEAVAAAARAAGLPLLDLRPVLAAQPIDRTYYPHDLHWTRAGHQAVTGPIADFAVFLWNSADAAQR